MLDIYFDSDFLISFLCFDEDYFNIVNSIFSGCNYIIPKEVLTELEKKDDIVLKRVNEMLETGVLTLYTIDVSDIPTATVAFMLQQRRKRCKKMGSGEAAAIALASTKRGVLASNNMRDVADYVDLQKVTHITTSRVIQKAYVDGLITIDKARSLWIKQTTRGSKMPDDSFDQFLTRDEEWPLE